MTAAIAGAALRLAAALAGDPLATDPPAAGVPADALHEKIVVVAERREVPLAETPAAVSTLSREQLSRLPATTVAEAVALLPGFHVLFDAPFGGLPMESARGFFGGGEAGYVLLRVDGVTLADAESGAAEWSALPASAVERVEALRGPAAPLYGDTAFGGVVELRTRRADDQPGLAAGLAAGRFDTVAADLRLARRGGRLAAALELDHRSTDGFRDHSADASTGARLRLDGAAGGGAWTASLSRLESEREDPGPLSFDQLTVDRRASDRLFAADLVEERRTLAAVGWSGIRGGGVELSTRLSAERRDLDAVRTLLLGAGFGDTTRRRLDAMALALTTTAGGKLGGSAGWSGGIDGGRDHLDSRHLPGVDVADSPSGPLAAVDVERTRRAAFLTTSWNISPSVRLSGALRWDGIEDAVRGARTAGRDAWSPRLAAVVRARPDGSAVLFASWGGAFKAPTLDQLFDPRPFPDGAGGSFTLANPALRPQRAATLEAGARGAAGERGWQLALYRTAVRDEIDFDPATFRYVNIGSSVHRGAELGGDLAHGSRGRLWLGWEWSEVFARDGETAGRQLKNVPEHSWRAIAELDLPSGLALTATARHLSGRWLDDAHHFPLGDATLVDLRLLRELGRWQVHLDLRNVLDDDFLWVGYALPDFAGGSVPYAFPGHPRAAIFGFRYRGADG
jgi:iron complex outermembrane receptor protein